MYTLPEHGDRIVSVIPNYQQLRSVPRSIGVNVCDVNLKPKLGSKRVIYG